MSLFITLFYREKNLSYIAKKISKKHFLSVKPWLEKVFVRKVSSMLFKVTMSNIFLLLLQIKYSWQCLYPGVWGGGVGVETLMSHILPIYRDMVLMLGQC